MGEDSEERNNFVPCSTTNQYEDIFSPEGARDAKAVHLEEDNISFHRTYIVGKSFSAGLQYK